MSTQSGHRPELTRGRKRDRERTDAILTATAELLFELGFDKLRIQDVATRAGSGLGTIYRRWKTKEVLVADAIRAIPDPEYVDTDDAARDLAAVVEDRALFFANNPDLVPGLIAALRTDDGIADAIRDRHDDEPLRRLFARLLGSDHPHVGLLAELVPAILLHRIVFQGRPAEPEAFARDVLSLAKALAHGDPPASSEV